MASPLKLTNNAIGRLTAGMSAVDTTAILVSGNGALFPTLGVGEFFPATIIRASDSAREIVKVTARSTDVLTVVRAQEGTSALVFIAGDRVELRLTAGTLSTEIARVEAVADAAQAAADAAQASADAADAAADAAAAAAAAADSSAVKRTGAQTIEDVKTFSAQPVVPVATESTAPVPKSQLDAALAAAIAPATLAPTLFVPDTAVELSSGSVATLSSVIPAWANEVVIVFDSVSSGSTGNLVITLGDSDGLETTGYSGLVLVIGSTTTSLSSGLILTSVSVATAQWTGRCHLRRITSGANSYWEADCTLGRNDASAAPTLMIGRKQLSGALTTVSLSVSSGSFDGGRAQLFWR